MFSFDSNPLVYWALGYLLGVVILFLNATNRVSDLVFKILSIGLLIYMRLPAIRYNRELNPDESQMISHALTLWYDPVYWRSVDGTTIGPLDNYWLMVPRLLGFQVNYSSARCMALLCIILALLFFFEAIKDFFGRRAARLALLLPLFLLAFTREADLIHYSSEQLPVLLLSLVTWTFVRLLAGTIRQSAGYYWLGFIAGVIPFSKLQAVPMALVLVVCLTIYCWRGASTFRQKIRSSALMVAGGLSFPLLVLNWAAANGVLLDLWDFYILGNLVYAGGGGSLASMPGDFFSLLRQSPDFLFYFLFILLLSAACFVWQRAGALRKAADKPYGLFIGFATAYILFSVYAVTKTGNPFGHYLNFCIYPLALLAAWFIGDSQGVKKNLSYAPILLLGWFVWSDGKAVLHHSVLNRYSSVGATTLGESETTRQIKTYTQPGDRMVVWGWQNTYYVEAQLPQGTAENHSERCIYPHPLRERYRSRYLSDLERNRPVVFIDAVGKNSLWLQDTLTQRYRSFPKLASYIDAHYVQVGSPQGNHLFIRKDRAIPKMAP